MGNAVLGIDPGATSGWAIVSISANPKLLRHGIFKFKDDASTVRELTLALDGLEDTVIKTFIENQFVSKNIQSTMKICKKAGRWEEASIYHGIDVEYIYPATWQSKELNGHKRATLKKASIAKCKGIWNVNLKEDTADASLIGRYAALRQFFIPGQ
jgi:Holliday junction resolvasome RuvABC endonuclease subunit